MRAVEEWVPTLAGVMKQLEQGAWVLGEGYPEISDLLVDAWAATAKALWRLQQLGLPPVPLRGFLLHGCEGCGGPLTADQYLGVGGQRCPGCGWTQGVGG